MILKIFAVMLIQMTAILAASIQSPLLQQLQEAIHKHSQLQPLQDTVHQQQQLLQMQRLPLQELPFQGIQQQLPLLEPLQGTIQQQRLALQEQMFALQQFQALQKKYLVRSPMSMNSPPILILFPNNEPAIRRKDFNTNSLKYHKPEEVGDEDSEVIDAEPIEETMPLRAVLLMPNTRSFIGDFISSIPFLPIEINVPDSISWIYNGILDIISGIGQRLPFRPQAPYTETQNENSMKSIWSQMKTQNMPIMVIPLRMSNADLVS